MHVYGSDVHNSTTRPFLFNKGLDFLDKYKRHELTDILLENNSRIITNQDFILLEAGRTRETEVVDKIFLKNRELSIRSTFLDKIPVDVWCTIGNVFTVWLYNNEN